MAYFDTIATQLGISVWFLVVLIMWEVAWKLLALWKSARHGSVIWFIALAVLNTAGILSILYIFVFSKMHHKLVRKTQKKKRR